MFYRMSFDYEVRKFLAVVLARANIKWVNVLTHLSRCFYENGKENDYERK
jgi:hypothetical protein